VLQRVAVCCNSVAILLQLMVPVDWRSDTTQVHILKVAVCRGVSQCVAVCCSVLQRVAVFGSTVAASLPVRCNMTELNIVKKPLATPLITRNYTHLIAKLL